MVDDSWQAGRDHTPKRRLGQIAEIEQMTDTHQQERHRRAARAIGFALTADHPEGWAALVPILGTRLTPPEAASLAWASLTAADPQDAADVAHAVLGEAGPPLTPFATIWPEARAWAATASNAERKCYAAAAVKRMPIVTRAAFLAWAGGEHHA